MLACVGSHVNTGCDPHVNMLHAGAMVGSSCCQAEMVWWYWH